MFKHSTFLAASVAAAVLAQAPAFAASSSTASLSNFTITLYDLDPLDGIASSITFAGLSYSYVLVSSPTLGSTFDGFHEGTAAFDASISSATIGLASAYASSTGGGSQATYTGSSPTLVGTLTAGGQASGGSPGSDSAAYAAQSFWNEYTSSTFTVSANTLVMFSATGHVNAAVTHGYTGLPNDFESSHGSVGLWVSGPSSGGSGFQLSSALLELSVDNTTFSNGSQGDRTGNLGVSFVNFGSGNLEGEFLASAAADGLSFAPAVPEPETYALMLAGLGALGYMSRRRKGASKA